jgi:hypothetical protein
MKNTEGRQLSLPKTVKHPHRIGIDANAGKVNAKLKPSSINGPHNITR